MKKNKWINTIAKSPGQYLGKYIVHDNDFVYFTSTSLTEANLWMSLNDQKHADLICFLLPKAFFEKRLL